MARNTVLLNNQGNNPVPRNIPENINYFRNERNLIQCNISMQELSMEAQAVLRHHHSIATEIIRTGRVSRENQDTIHRINLDLTNIDREISVMNQQWVLYQQNKFIMEDMAVRQRWRDMALQQQQHFSCQFPSPPRL